MVKSATFVQYFIYLFDYTSRTQSKKRKYSNQTKINAQNYKWKNLAPNYVVLVLF